MSTITHDDKDALARAHEEILANLAMLGGRLQREDEVIFSGSEFRLPEKLDIDQGIRFLENYRDEQQRHTVFSAQFDYRPMDGAYCMVNAMKREFGVVGHRGTMGFWGPNPPEMRTIAVAYGKKKQIPWGVFDLPFLPGVRFETDDYWHPELGPLFQITASGPKKYQDEINGVFALIERELRTNSMYRGKAFDGQMLPDFLDLSGVDPEKIVYSEEVVRQLGANIWVLLRNTAVCEEMGTKLKRAILLHGPYGTGKTLAAMLTALIATENGWTFIKARPGRDNISDVLQTARLYDPCVVFYEDVDEIADPTNTPHGGSISRLLDDFDGFEAKDTKIVMVLTTNHVDRIHKAMGRPGRLDAMIKIDQLDLAGMEKLVRSIIPAEQLADDVDWDAVYDASSEYMPAFVTEFAGRTVLYAMNANDGKLGNGMIGTDELVGAAEDLRSQYDVMIGAKDRVEKDTLAAALQSVVAPIVEAAADRAVRRQMQDNLLVDEEAAARDAAASEPLA